MEFVANTHNHYSTIIPFFQQLRKTARLSNIMKLFISSSQDRKDENTGKYMFTFFIPQTLEQLAEHFANCQFLGQNQHLNKINLRRL